MTNHYQLKSNEAMIMRTQRVAFGNQTDFSHELSLTSQNIIFTRKGWFGGVKEMNVYPLSQVKVFHQQAQVLLTKTAIGHWKVEIYMLHGVLTFGVETKKVAEEWKRRIGQIVTGNGKKVAVGNNNTTELEKLTEQVSEYIGGVGDTLKSAFGISFGLEKSKKAPAKNKTAQPKKVPAPKKEVVGKCTGCGASLTGKQTTIASCEYCDTKNQL